MEPGIIVLIVIAAFLFIWMAVGIKIIRPYQKGVVEQLGRYKSTYDPGLKFVIPIIQSVTKVDMRERVVDVPPQEVITKDNVTVTVDAVIYYEPTDPQRLIYNVANFVMAITKLAQTNLRNVIGDMTLDSALTSRDTVNVSLREVLDDAAAGVVLLARGDQRVPELVADGVTIHQDHFDCLVLLDRRGERAHGRVRARAELI